MGLDLGYKVDVAANSIKTPIEVPLSSLQNALEHCHDGRGFFGEPFLGAFLLILFLIFLELQHGLTSLNLLVFQKQ